MSSNSALDISCKPQTGRTPCSSTKQTNKSNDPCCISAMQTYLAYRTARKQSRTCVMMPMFIFGPSKMCPSSSTNKPCKPRSWLFIVPCLLCTYFYSWWACTSVHMSGNMLHITRFHFWVSLQTASRTNAATSLHQSLPCTQVMCLNQLCHHCHN